ncbi:MAG: di-heme oxidoredictase family protein, partial [Pseudomonas sp.]|nr:di-heme oxidoredictase family protein [Pseudomonas sp.]
DTPQVLTGKNLFYQAGCQGCHNPTFTTAADAAEPELANQVIRPYSDLLLHDMGPGLADNRPEFLAGGQEWRTPPLWGIGLTETVNGHTQFLHDGRARNLLEAILWHGGEAEAAKQQVLTFNADERAALLAFLNSL